MYIFSIEQKERSACKLRSLDSIYMFYIWHWLIHMAKTVWQIKMKQLFQVRQVVIVYILVYLSNLDKYYDYEKNICKLKNLV